MVAAWQQDLIEDEINKLKFPRLVSDFVIKKIHP